MFSLPVSPLQPITFTALGLVFLVYFVRTLAGRGREVEATRDSRSTIGIVVQSGGIAIAGFGPVKPTLAPLSAAGLVGTAGVLLLMVGVIALFATSSRELGRNWSLVARMRSDHELIRSGPYALVRHPIYLGLLLFLLALAVGLGHWLQLLVALPVFFVGTLLRTRTEDRLLEQSFGQTFRDYRGSTPAIFPKII